MSTAFAKRSTIRLMRDFEAMDRTSCECEDHCGCGQRRCAIIDVLARRIRVSGEQMHDIYMEHGTGAIMALVRNCIQKAPRT